MRDGGRKPDFLPLHRRRIRVFGRSRRLRAEDVGGQLLDARRLGDGVVDKPRSHRKGIQRGIPAQAKPVARHPDRGGSVIRPFEGFQLEAMDKAVFRKGIDISRRLGSVPVIANSTDAICEYSKAWSRIFFTDEGIVIRFTFDL